MPFGDNKEIEEAWKYIEANLKEYKSPLKEYRYTVFEIKNNINEAVNVLTNLQYFKKGNKFYVYTLLESRAMGYLSNSNIDFDIIGRKEMNNEEL